MGYPPIYSVRNLRADPQLITDLEVKAQSTSRKDGAVTVSGQVARSSRLTTLEFCRWGGKRAAHLSRRRLACYYVPYGTYVTEG